MSGTRVIDVTGKEIFSITNPGMVQQVGSNVADAQTLWTPGMLYNETTSDKPRGNTQGTLLASAARTATTNSAVQTNYNARGVMVFLRVTAASGTGGLTTLLLGQDPATSQFHTLTASPTTRLAVGLWIYTLYPGVSSVGGNVDQASSGTLPRTWQIQVNHTDASSYTYSVSYQLIL